MKSIVLLFILFFNSYLTYSQTSGLKINWSFIVNDDTTAIKIAEAIWLPKVGSNFYNMKKPYRAKLVDDSIWVVHGTIGAKKGGSPTTYIQKKDGMVIKIGLTK